MNSTELRGYLTGLILGDGHIDSGVEKRAFSIKSINEDFAQQIYKDLTESTNFKIKYRKIEGYTDGNNVNHKINYEVKIDAHPYFNKKYHYFYDDKRRRRITKESLHWLNLRGLANWYMSDGYICLVGKTKGVIKDRRVDLCTDRYTKNDIEKIRTYFLETWGWETSLIQRKTNNKLMYRIRFKKASAQDFLYQIHPFITPSFYYKLDMCYDYQPSWMNDDYYYLMLEIQKREHPNSEIAEGKDIVYGFEGSPRLKNLCQQAGAASSAALTLLNS